MINTHTHTQAAVTHIEVEGDEVLSLDAGVVLVIDPPVRCPAQLETQLAMYSSVHV